MVVVYDKMSFNSPKASSQDGWVGSGFRCPAHWYSVVLLLVRRNKEVRVANERAPGEGGDGFEVPGSIFREMLLLTAIL